MGNKGGQEVREPEMRHFSDKVKWETQGNKHEDYKKGNLRSLTGCNIIICTRVHGPFEDLLLYEWKKWSEN